MFFSETYSSGSTNLSSKAFSLEEWNSQMQVDCGVTKGFLNGLIMDYFIIEGYRDAAESFSKESCQRPGIPLESINDRVQIRTKINEGKIEEAIKQIEIVDANILKCNHNLKFMLYQQQFIEIFRQGDVNVALEFARQTFLPEMSTDTDFMSIFEETIALVLFTEPDEQNSLPLMDLSRRNAIADEINSAILLQQCKRKETEINEMLRLLVIAQQDLKGKNISFPSLSDLSPK